MPKSFIKPELSATNIKALARCLGRNPDVTPRQLY